MGAAGRGTANRDQHSLPKSATRAMLQCSDPAVGLASPDPVESLRLA